MDEADFNEMPEDVAEQEEELDPNDANQAFAILEKSYNKTVSEMEDDPNLIQYTEVFGNVFDFLYKTYQNAKELEAANEALEEINRQQEEHIVASGQMLATNDTRIKKLEEEIEISHRMTDNAHIREQAAQEIIDNLRKQILNLNAEIDFRNKMAQSDLEDPQVTKHREGLEREKVKLMSEVSKLTEKLNNALAYQDELERRTSAADVRINEISTQLEETSADVDRYKRNKDKMENELAEVRAATERQLEEIDNLTEVIAKNQKLIVKYELQVKEQMVSGLKCFKELEGWNAKHAKLQDDLDALNYHNEIIKNELQKSLRDVKARTDEKGKLAIDIVRMQKQKEQADNLTKRIENDKFVLLQDRNKLREVISGMERDIEASKRQIDSDKRTIENLSREKDILNKNILRQQAVTRDHIKVIKVQEQTKRKLEIEIDCHVIERRRHTKQISYLEKERDRLLEEELDLTKKIEDTMDEIRLKKIEIFELKKTLAENQNKLRMQQNTLDAVRADKNALQKTMQESMAENSELKKKLKTISHQAEQLKEEISGKEHLLIKEENILRKVTKERENMKIELNVCWDQIRSLKDDINVRKSEEKRLHGVIINSDRMMREQQKTITQLMNERDVLGTQLVRRNDEISLLYEKIKILQTTLHRGQAQYDQRLEDIKLLKVEIKRLRQEKSLLTKSINNMNDLKQEVFHLERDLTKERLKTKALEDELQNPMNIHRWRKLEGTDPEVYELLQKTTLLQKRLLKEAAKNIEKERQLKETEKLFANLRQMISKQPGPDVQKQLLQTQKSLTQHITRMKCLVSELNLTELQVDELKKQLAATNEELAKVKKQLLREKKEHAKDLDQLKLCTAKLVEQEEQSRFLASGYRVTN